MPLFRRRAAASPEGRIGSFWRWWRDEGRAAAERSTQGAPEAEAFAATMTAQVHRLGDLGWELARGEGSEHVLVLTAEGEAGLRALARRTVMAAPEPDEAWSYQDTRPAAEDPESVVLAAADGAELSFADVVVGARLSGTRFDVTVHHPVFPELPEETRTQVSFLALDSALGEVDTELWLGEVTASEVAPLDAFGLSALRAVVQDLKGKHLDADGAPSWVLLQGETSQGPLLATARSLLHPLVAPHLDTHVAVVLPYSDAAEDGLPGDSSLEHLRALEDRLSMQLGASGMVVAHQSVAGVRTLHVYVDSTAGVLPSVTRVAASWGEGHASVHDMPDPGWAAVTHLRP